MKLGLEIDELPGWYTPAKSPTADLIVNSVDSSLRDFLALSSNSLPVRMHFFKSSHPIEQVQILLDDPEGEQGGARDITLHRSNDGESEVRVLWDAKNLRSRLELQRLIKELASP